MELPIEWNDGAFDEFLQIYSYLSENFGSKHAEAFQVDAIRRIEYLSQFPLMGNIADPFSGLRKLVIPPFNAVYYLPRVEGILIVSFFETRQDPSKLSSKPPQ